MVVKRRMLPPCMGTLRVLVSNNVVSLQCDSLCPQPIYTTGKHPSETSAKPSAATAAIQPIPTLNLDLKSGQVSITWIAPMPDDTPVALGVLGMFQLGTGSVLVIITKATQVRMGYIPQAGAFLSLRLWISVLPVKL